MRHVAAQKTLLDSVALTQLYIHRWSNLGLYLSSLTIEANPSAAYAIRGLFLTVALLVHGFLRSYAPRLFVALVLLIIVSVVNMLSTARQVTTTGVTQILYPVLIATGVILLVNLFIFPEFSSSFLGQKTIETLSDIAVALERAGYYFTHSDQGENIQDPEASRSEQSGLRKGHQASHDIRGGSVIVGHTLSVLATKASKSSGEATSGTNAIRQRPNKSPEANEPTTITLGDLTAAKGALRKKLSECKSAQSECNFEIAYAGLPPRDLKPISGKAMTKLLANVVAVISTCESKFALVGDFGQTKSAVENSKLEDLDIASESNSLEPTKRDLEMVKPKREIEFGDVRLLHYLLKRIENPYSDLIKVLNKTIASMCP